MISVLLFIAIHWYVSLFFQTFFLHRYASHGLYTMGPLSEKVFFLLTFITQGSSFLNPAAYAVMHRRHHSCSDTPKDPHSPVFISSIIEFNKRTFLEYRSLVTKFLSNELKVDDVPRWPALEKISESLMVRGLFIGIYFTIYYMISPSPWYYLLIPLHVFMGPIHGFIVNWFGHLRGYRNFDEVGDNSRNTLPIDLLMMGELYQNNHHKRPKNRNFAYRWFEMDLGYVFASILQKCNIISAAKGSK